MQIHQYPAIPNAPADADVLAIEVNGITYKVSKAVLADAIIAKLGGDPVTIAHGGTGSSTAANARTNLSVYSKSETDSAIVQSTAGSKTIVGVYTSTVTLPEITMIGFLVHDYGGTVSAYALYGSRCDLITGAGGITTDGNTSGQTLTFPREGTNRILFIYK